MNKLSKAKFNASFSPNQFLKQGRSKIEIRNMSTTLNVCIFLFRKCRKAFILIVFLRFCFSLVSENAFLLHLFTVSVY